MTQRTGQSEVRIPGAVIRLGTSAGGLAQWRRRGRSLAAAWVLNPRGERRVGRRPGARLFSPQRRVRVLPSTPSPPRGTQPRPAPGVSKVPSRVMRRSSGKQPSDRRLLSIYSVPGAWRGWDPRETRCESTLLSV